jgi:SAM-dependent methyltransferase
MTTTDHQASPAAADPAALDEFLGRVGAQATAAVNAMLVALGDRLGLWQAMAGAGPLTPAELAARSGTSARCVTEWLASQAASGLVGYDPAAGTFTLSPEAAMVLADEESPALMIAAFQGMALVSSLLPALADAFTSGDGIAWADHDAEFFDVQERFSRPLLRQFLIDVWLAAVPGLTGRLAAGARVAEIGCGYGTGAILLAQRFPAARCTGFDFHDHSIARARAAASRAGVADRVRFEVADAAAASGGPYDLVLFTDSLHDMGDPVTAAGRARELLAGDGLVVTLDPVATGSLAEDLASPMAAMMYAVSSFLCTPTAMAQHGPRALGAMAGEAALRGILADAGFTSVERVAPDAPMNMILTARR